jgi:lipopolysaccharide/colanic/teichoic acid biosynthesis glycosyltransferase
VLKRCFDIGFSVVGFLFLLPIGLIVWLLASVDTHSNGFFFQQRIGQFGKPFTIYKLRTMHIGSGKISKFGAFLRKFKLDELLQLFNILKGDMSVVGPRPDIAGYYDVLNGVYRKILELKPGLTSLAAIKYANEEEVLAQQEDPLKYIDEVIFPDKVQLNLMYYYNHTFWGDLKIIWITFLKVLGF